MNARKALFLGLMVADGCVSGYDTHVEFFNENPQLRHLVITLIREFGRNPRERRRWNGWKVYAYAPELAEEVRRYKEHPELLLKLSDEHAKHFLRGFILGDGSLTSYPVKIEIVQFDTKRRKVIKTLLERLGYIVGESMRWKKLWITGRQQERLVKELELEAFIFGPKSKHAL